MPSLFIQLIAFKTSSDLSKFIAEHLPFVRADNKTNRILKDLSPSTSMNFFLKFPIFS